MSEQLLVDDNKYVLFPIPQERMPIWEHYKKSMGVFWTAEEIKLSQDVLDWEKLSDDERHFIEFTLAFFAASDGVVNENLGTRFFSEVQWPEARCFYGFQIAMENIHNETYSLLIDTLIKDTKKKDNLFHSINTIPCISQKAKWAEMWITSSDSFATRLVAFAAVEGIFFSGSFASIFWLKKRGIMPGLCFSNELISRDEGMHCDFACMLYNKYINNKLTDAEIHKLLGEAVDIERNFIRESLPCNLVGMNADKMAQYIEFVCDRLCVQLGHPKLYNVKNPLDFMVQQGMEIKANFFENRVSSYSKAGVGMNEEDMSFSLESEF